MKTLNKNVFKQPFFWTSVCCLLAVGTLVGLYAYAWVAPTASPNSSAGAAINFNNGNIGVGTTNPGSKLEVNGIISTTNAGTLGGDINAGSGGVYSYNGPSRYIRFNTNGGANDLLSAGAAMVINYSGSQNVEFFGGAAATAYVNGNLSLGGGAFDYTPASTRTLSVRAGASQSSTALLDVKDNGGTNHWLYVAGGGNVGIGNAGPTHKLDVAGDLYITGNTNICTLVAYTGGSGTTYCPTGYYTWSAVGLTDGYMLCCKVSNPV